MPLESAISQEPTPPSTTRPPDPPDVHRVLVQGREFVLIGTAHVAQESADLARDVITQEQPDCVLSVTMAVGAVKLARMKSIV